MENEEKRMLGDYEVRQSIHIGKKEVVFGVNEADKYPFMVCFCTYDNPFSAAWATEAVGTDDYLEAMQIFTDRVQAQKIYKKYSDMIDERYESLDEADKKTVWYKPTEKAKEYRAYESEMRKKMYCEIAERCEEYDKKQKSRDLER